MSKISAKYNITYDGTASKLDDFIFTPKPDALKIALNIHKQITRLGYHIDNNLLSLVTYYTEQFYRANVLKSHLKVKLKEKYYLLNESKKARRRLKQCRQNDPFLNHFIQYEDTGETTVSETPHLLTNEAIQSMFDSSPQLSVLFSRFHFFTLPIQANLKKYVLLLDHIFENTHKLSAYKRAALIKCALSAIDFKRSQRTIANIICQGITISN